MAITAIATGEDSTHFAKPTAAPNSLIASPPDINFEVDDLSAADDGTVVDDFVVGATGSTGATATVISQNAAALAVGRQGATSPAFLVDSATASGATGVKVTAAAAAGGVAVAAISSGTDEAMTIDAKGTGTLTLAGTSTGNVVVPRALVQGTDATDRVTIKGIYMSPANVVVAVPSIANDVPENVDSVAVNVAAAFSMQPAVGDAVIAIPQEALPTDCLLVGAYVTATDQITVAFASQEAGGGVTGANKNFKFLVFDLT